MTFSDYIFSVYNQDELVAEVAVTDNRRQIDVKKYTEDPGIQPFCGENITLERVYNFIKYRCFEECRPDKEMLLEALGLSEYNPWEIVKKTHGRLWQDFTWIRFPGEELAWKDVE